MNLLSLHFTMKELDGWSCHCSCKREYGNATITDHSGKSATIREPDHGLGVCKELYVWYYVPKSFILLTGTGVWKISSVACGFRSIKIDYSDYSKSLISRINEVYVLSKYDLHLSRFFHTCHCVNMVSVTSASRYITPASRYHPRYQSRASIYIRGLIPRNFAK